MIMMEDQLQRKTTFDGRQPSMEDNFFLKDFEISLCYISALRSYFGNLLFFPLTYKASNDILALLEYLESLGTLYTHLHVLYFSKHFGTLETFLVLLEILGTSREHLGSVTNLPTSAQIQLPLWLSEALFSSSNHLLGHAPMEVDKSPEEASYFNLTKLSQAPAQALQPQKCLFLF